MIVTVDDKLLIGSSLVYNIQVENKVNFISAYPHQNFALPSRNSRLGSLASRHSSVSTDQPFVNGPLTIPSTTIQ